MHFSHTTTGSVFNTYCPGGEFGLLQIKYPAGCQLLSAELVEVLRSHSEASLVDGFSRTGTPLLVKGMKGSFDHFYPNLSDFLFWLSIFNLHTKKIILSLLFIIYL